MIDMEDWVCELLDDIEKAAEKNENYDLHLEAPMVKELADSLKGITNIELS